MTQQNTALRLAELLNEGTDVWDALEAVGLDEDDVFGEDLGDEFLPLDDAQNTVIDLGWDGDLHYELKKIQGTWEVRQTRMLTKDGVPIAS